MAHAQVHEEHMKVPGRRLGRRPFDPEMPQLNLGKYLTGRVPAHPTAVDHFGRVTDWGMYGNDHFGVCGPTGVANDRKLVTRYLTDEEVSPSQQDVFDLYRLSGNPDFDPETGEDDNGVNLQVMLGAVQKYGIGDGRGGKVRCLGFAAVDTHSPEEVRAAIAIFGSVLFGVNLELAQQGQTDTWSYSQSPPWGGHCVMGGLYVAPVAKDDYPDVSIITWASVVQMSMQFERHQVDEAWVVIWPEHLNDKFFMDGVKLDALKSDFKALTGRTFPTQQSAYGAVSEQGNANGESEKPSQQAEVATETEGGEQVTES